MKTRCVDFDVIVNISLRIVTLFQSPVSLEVVPERKSGKHSAAWHWEYMGCLLVRKARYHHWSSVEPRAAS